MVHARWWCVVGLAALAAAGACADDPAKGPAQAERNRLTAEINKANAEGIQLFGRGDYPAAAKRLEAALDLLKQLFPAAAYPNGDIGLADGYNNLGVVYMNL